ncbi:MAG: hypothetical protein RMZ69_13480 [Nostoc sp. ChiQUE01a]|nr:hypothetical protein [Nostoc sp. ChiQUE01a]
MGHWAWGIGHGNWELYDRYHQWIFVRRPDFEDLEVYQLAEKLANEIWHIVKVWDNFS